jgi:hypothetical protein
MWLTLHHWTKLSNIRRSSRYYGKTIHLSYNNHKYDELLVMNPKLKEYCTKSFCD